MLLLFSCAQPEETGPDAVDTADTGTTVGWTSTRIAPERLVAAAGAFAVGEEGRILSTSPEWTEHAASVVGEVRAADALGDALWVLTADDLAEWDGAWRTTPLPAPGADLVVSAFGGTHVLAPHMDCDDCEGAVVSNALWTWDGVWTAGEPALAEDWLYALTELDDGTRVAVGTDVAHWSGADWVWEGSDGLALWDVVADGEAILAVGDGGAVVRGRPGALSTEQVGEESFVAAAVDGDTAWALGETAAWYDAGAGWVQVPLPEGSWVDLAVSADGVYVVGDERGPVALEWDGSTFVEVWREIAVPIGPPWVDAAGTAWIAGDNRIGTWAEDGTLSAWSFDQSFRAIAGASPEDVVAAADEGLVEWDGVAWTETARSGPGMWWDVAVAPDGAAFAAGGGWGEDESQWPILGRRTDAGWVEEVSFPVTANALIAVEAFAADDVYALTWGGEAALLRWEGSGWEVLAEGLEGGPTVLWGRAGDDLYLGGDGLWHWDGESVSPVAGAPGGVHGLGGDADGLLVAGTEGYGDDWAPLVQRYEDGVWTTLFTDDDVMYVGSGPTASVVLVGRDGWRAP